MSDKNMDIRMIVAENGLRYKDIAEEMQITNIHLSCLMRHDLSVKSRAKIMKAIKTMIKRKEEKTE